MILLSLSNEEENYQNGTFNECYQGLAQSYQAIILKPQARLINTPLEAINTCVSSDNQVLQRIHE